MPFQSVPDTAMFSCIFSLFGNKRAQFGVYVRNTQDPWDASQLVAMADALNDAIQADYLPALSTDHSFLGTIGRDLEVQYGRVEEQMLGAPAPGTLASGSLPANVAVVATFKSAVGAPRRGRIFLMPPAESQVTGNLLTGGAQTALQGAADAIHAAADGGINDAHVIVSRYSGRALDDADEHGQVILKPTPRAVAIAATVAAVQVRSRTDSQRNRLIDEAA